MSMSTLALVRPVDVGRYGWGDRVSRWKPKRERPVATETSPFEMTAIRLLSPGGTDTLLTDHAHSVQPVGGDWTCNGLCIDRDPT